MIGGIYMKEYYFLFSSITTAMRSENIFRNRGYRAAVFKDSGINPHGCGYTVKVFGDKNELRDLLSRNGITVREIREAN